MSLICVVEFELLFGLWLLANLYPKWTWWAALACFSAFACVTFYKALAGEASCGCFGRVPVNPLHTLLLDSAAIAALLAFRPPSLRYWEKGVARPRLAGVATAFLVLGFPSGWAMAIYQSATLSNDGDIIGDAPIVVLEPDTWIGKRFPLLDYIDIGDKLKEGKWLVLLYHHDCPKCKEIAPKYERFSRRWPADSVAPQVAIVEVPPYRDRGFVPQFSGTRYRRGLLSNKKEWLVETPVELSVQQGRVSAVTGSQELSRRVSIDQSQYWPPVGGSLITNTLAFSLSSVDGISSPRPCSEVSVLVQREMETSIGGLGSLRY